MKHLVKTRIISRENLIIEADDTPEAEMKAIELWEKGGISNNPTFEIISIERIDDEK
jgi:hypothetical protein